MTDPTPEQRAEAESLCIAYDLDSATRDAVACVTEIIREAEQRGAARQRETDARICLDACDHWRNTQTADTVDALEAAADTIRSKP